VPVSFDPSVILYRYEISGGVGSNVAGAWWVLVAFLTKFVKALFPLIECVVTSTAACVAANGLDAVETGITTGLVTVRSLS
jgi:hypothetical protein